MVLKLTIEQRGFYWLVRDAWNVMQLITVVSYDQQTCGSTPYCANLLTGYDISVLVPPEIDEITWNDQRRNFTLNEGESIELPCVASKGRPTPEVYWTRGTRYLVRFFLLILFIESHSKNVKSWVVFDIWIFVFYLIYCWHYYISMHFINRWLVLTSWLFWRSLVMIFVHLEIN